jgi:Flp pilus assembly protein TadG
MKTPGEPATSGTAPCRPGAFERGLAATELVAIMPAVMALIAFLIYFINYHYRHLAFMSASETCATLVTQQPVVQNDLAEYSADISVAQRDVLNAHGVGSAPGSTLIFPQGFLGGPIECWAASWNAGNNAGLGVTPLRYRSNAVAQAYMSNWDSDVPPMVAP